MIPLFAGEPPVLAGRRREEDHVRGVKRAQLRSPQARGQGAALQHLPQHGAGAGVDRDWAPEFGGRNGFPPPEKNELVLSIEMGCADTVPFQPKPNTPF